MSDSIIIRTTAELVQQNISRIESRLNQTTPPGERSFVRVIAGVQAMGSTTGYKALARAILEVYATTASRNGLIVIGEQINLEPNPAVGAVLQVEVPAEEGAQLPPTTEFVGDANGMRYRIDATGYEDDGSIIVTVTAFEAGVSGNLQIGSLLSIASPVSGVGVTATVIGVQTTGAEEEDTEAFRARILDELRAEGGGGNSADYRKWAQELAGVFRAYPYSGLPWPLSEGSAPPDRTVYIQTTSEIDPDGIPDQPFLDQVREIITYDPETGRTRQPLGLTDETLYIEPIRRTEVFVNVYNLVVPAQVLAQVQTEIQGVLDVTLRSLRPFVPGLDVESERNDLVTATIIGSVLLPIVSLYGGSIERVTIGLTLNSTISSVQLTPGETAKLGAVSFVQE